MMFLIGYPLVLLLLSYFIFIRNLTARRSVKWSIFLVSLVASFKNQIVFLLGGDILAPDLPRELLTALSTLHVFLIFAIMIGSLLWVFYMVKGAVKLRFFKRFPRFNIWQLSAVFILAFAISLYATYESLKDPQIVYHSFINSIFPIKSDYYNKPFRIVHITDTHLGSNVTKEQARRFVELINKEEPDIVLFTGDMIDGAPKVSIEQLNEFKAIKAPYGVYAVRGNHEYYSDTQVWAPYWQEFGFTLLNNAHITIKVANKEVFTLAGVTDIQAVRMKDNPQEGPDLTKALEGANEALPVILMSHRPAQFKQYVDDNKVFLMLSGHTHGGMLPGLKQLVAFFNGGFVSGLYKYHDSYLIIGNGTFTWGGFCARILTPSQIVVIDLKAAD